MEKSVYFVFEITPRCNAACIYCYNVWKKSGYVSPGELNDKNREILLEKIINETKPAGITITGGEPLLHEGVLKTAQLITSMDVPVGIATNGILLERDMTAALVDAGVSYFEISLPAAGRSVFLELCGIDAVESVRKAILNVKSLKSRLSVTFVITSKNLGELVGVIDLCLAFSVDSLVLNRFVPGGEGLMHAAELLPSADQLGRALRIADRKAAKHSFPIYTGIPIEDCLFDHSSYTALKFGTCTCGEKKWAIDPVGNLRVCEQSPVLLGNLLENTFIELSEKPYVQKFRNDNYKSECRNCEKYSACGGGCRFINK